MDGNPAENANSNNSASAAPPGDAGAAASSQTVSQVENLQRQKQQIFESMAQEKERVVAETLGQSNGSPVSGLPGLDQLVAVEIARTIKQLVDDAVDKKFEQLLQDAE